MWRQSAADPKKGEALIQLFELPNGVFVDEAPRRDSPVNRFESGSLGCQIWLRGEDSNLGHGD